MFRVPTKSQNRWRPCCLFPHRYPQRVLFFRNQYPQWTNLECDMHIPVSPQQCPSSNKLAIKRYLQPLAWSRVRLRSQAWYLSFWYSLVSEHAYLQDWLRIIFTENILYPYSSSKSAWDTRQSRNVSAFPDLGALLQTWRSTSRLVKQVLFDLNHLRESWSTMQRGLLCRVSCLW